MTRIIWTRKQKIVGWTLASPFIIFIGWAIVMPLTVSLYYALSSHPDKIHGDHPDEYAGLFISEDAESDDPFALVLRFDGRKQIGPGGESFWHVEGDKLVIDSYPAHCLTPFPSRNIIEYKCEWDGSDKLILRSDRAGSRFDGTHVLVRTNIDLELWNEVNRLMDEPGFSLRAQRIWVALRNARVNEEDLSTWDDLEPAAN